MILATTTDATTTAKAGIGMGSFLGLTIIFLIGFYWGKKRRRMLGDVHLSTAPPGAELPPNVASAIWFGRRHRTRHLERPSEVSNTGEIRELQGSGATIPP